jgi:type IV secretory pathway VirB2 component (pilin)
MPPSQLRFSNSGPPLPRIVCIACLFALGFVLPAYAQSPWENAVDVLRDSFTGAIARGLSLVAIVVGGLMFAFGEGDSKRMLAGIVFGVGMAIGAVNFMAWLFP